jgi:hypothetical protein
MPVRRIAAASTVAADAGRVAVQRGPLVYCAEWPDAPGGHVRNLVVAPDAPLASASRPDLLNGVRVVTTTATAVSLDASGTRVERREPVTLIPYYAWANRGRGEMIVWLATNDAVVRAQPGATLASAARAAASFNEDTAGAMNDQEEPASSRDRRVPIFQWWPHKGTTEWAEYAFSAPSTVSSVDVYWFDDTGTGECRVPASWRVLYRDGDAWRPVEGASIYAVERDRYNRTTFAPVRTPALRLELKLRDGFSAGVLEWRVGK